MKHCWSKIILSNICFMHWEQCTFGVVLDLCLPSGPNAGAGNVSQSSKVQVSLVQSAVQTLTLRSALQANQQMYPSSDLHCQ